MVYLALVVGGGSLAVSLWVLRALTEVRDRPVTAPSPPPPPEYDDSELRRILNDHADQLDAQEEELEKQRLAIAEGIERVDRAERRIRSTVSRAKARMEEGGYDDPALTAEYEALRDLDGGGGGVGGMQRVPASVEEPEAPDMSAFPGDWS